MAVLAIKTEKLCKLCQHPRRPEIDALLELRSNLGRDDAGKRVTADYVIAVLGEWGMANPNLDNLKIHWRKHCQKVSGQEVAAAQSAVTLALEAMRTSGELPPVNVNEDLDWLWRIYMLETREKVGLGQKSGITHDLALKIAAEKTRRAHNETQDELMRALGGGIAAAFGYKAPAEIPETIVAAEFVEVE